MNELEVQIGFQTAAGPRLRQFELYGDPFVKSKVLKGIRHLRFNPTTAVSKTMAYEFIQGIPIIGVFRNYILFIPIIT